MTKTGTQKAENGKRTPFSVRVRDDAMRKRLHTAAKKEGVSMTHFMRDAVYEAVERSEKA